MAKYLHDTLKDKKELRDSVASALRKLIASAIRNENAEDIEQISRFANNFLRMLFEIYNIAEDAATKSMIFDTIKVSRDGDLASRQGLLNANFCLGLLQDHQRKRNRDFVRHCYGDSEEGEHGEQG